MIFIIPATDEKTAQGDLKEMIIHTLPFGIGALAAILERDGVPVRILNDGINEVTPSQIRQLAGSETGRPVFGLTSLTLQAHRAKELRSMILEAVPDAAVIVGGIHASAMPDEFLDAGFDLVFHGEADTVITDLVTRLSGREDISGIRGLIWKDSSGTVHKNPPAELIDLKDVPSFPYHLFEHEINHYDLGALLSSRGCPYQCIFCSQRSITGLRYRTRPVDQVLDELALVVERFGSDFITFFDDNFVVDRNRLKEICGGLVSRGFHKRVSFMCQMRGDAATPETLGLLKDAGFVAVSFGIETGSERIALTIRKGEKVEHNAKAVRLAHDMGLQTLGTFIIGFPTETDEDRRQTISLAMSLPLDVLRINIAIPYPGTPFYEMVKNDIHKSEGWRNFNVVSPLVTGPFRKLPLPYIPDGTTEDELRRLMLWNNLRFWLRPRGLAAFFFKKSTFVTRRPKKWYAKPEYLKGVLKMGLTTLENLAWIAATGLKNVMACGRRNC